MFMWLRDIWSDFLESVNDFAFWLSHSILIPMRYDVTVKNAECLDVAKGGVDRSVIFLANHSSHIDPTIIATDLLTRGLPLTIWALDLTFKLPYLRWAARRKETVQVVKVPNIPERRSEKHLSNLHKLVTRTADGLKRGKNFLIFPSGVVKKTPLEKINGKSAVPLIIQQCPNVNIILVRITGLWGSRFSCAKRQEERWGTQSVSPWKMFWQCLKMVVFNGIFFIPKRKVLIEYIPAGIEFPRFGSRLEISRYIENKFNEVWGPHGEPLYKVPDYFWKRHGSTHEYVTHEYVFNINAVPKPIRNAVVALVADKANLDCKDIDFSMSLGRDLGLDSLDIVEVLYALEQRFNIPPLVPDNVTSVGHLIALAAKIPIACEVKPGEFHRVEEHKTLPDRFSSLVSPLSSAFSSKVKK